VKMENWLALIILLCFIMHQREEKMAKYLEWLLRLKTNQVQTRTNGQRYCVFHSVTRWLDFHSELIDAHITTWKIVPFNVFVISASYFVMHSFVKTSISVHSLYAETPYSSPPSLFLETKQ
jgi:hypothetical protein